MVDTTSGAARHLQWGMGAPHPEGPLTSRAPPPNLNFRLGFRPLHLKNMEKNFLVKFCRKKRKIPDGGTPNYPRGLPISIFSSDFGHFILKYDKTSVFVRFCRKHVKMPALCPPQHAMGGHVPPVPPPGCVTGFEAWGPSDCPSPPSPRPNAKEVFCHLF